METLTKLSIFLFILIAIFQFSVSKFGNLNEILNTTYNSRGCEQENRQNPSGKVPASYFGLNKAERDNIQQTFERFYKNDQYKQSI